MAVLRVKNTKAIYIFNNSEKLTLAINCLYSNRSTRMCKSELYLLNKQYYLAIIFPKNRSIEKIREFSDGVISYSQYIPVLQEYAKRIIEKDAIKIYGRAFAKYF